jgi:hypothetical protein
MPLLSVRATAKGDVLLVAQQTLYVWLLHVPFSFGALSFQVPWVHTVNTRHLLRPLEFKPNTVALITWPSF